MFALLVTAVCVLEVVSTFRLGLASNSYAAFFQLEVIAVALMALLTEGRREKYVLSVLAFWFLWQFATDWMISYVPAMAVNIETVFFVVLVFFVLLRPYYLPSPLLNKANIAFAFYRGGHPPILSKISTILGLPYSSLSIIAGDLILRSGRNGVMRSGVSDAIKPSDYYFMDTQCPVTQETRDLILSCAGKTTRVWGIFRIKCISNMLPVLLAVGVTPRNPLFFIPSLFFYQCLTHFYRETRYAR